MTRCLLYALLLFPSLAFADQGPVVVPISQTMLPDGDIRYSVPVQVGNSAIVPALLDTGSTGLRIMNAALASYDFADAGLASLYEFSGGDVLSGTIGTGVVTVGSLSTDDAISFEVVTRTGCVSFRPQCSASLLSPADYGIGGDGIANQGFQAILGISLEIEGGAGYAENPLAHIGSRRWIIHLPEPGQTNTGALILSPDDADLQGFQLFKLVAVPAAGRGLDSGWADALPACLSNATTGQRACGASILDTGSPGMIADVQGGVVQPLWAQDDRASLSFGLNGQGTGFSFVVDRNPGTGLLQEPAQNNALRLIDGFLPFFYFDVLYDAADGEIGLRPREDAPNAVAAPNEAGDQSMEVIELNAPAPGAPKLPEVIMPTP